MRKIDVLIWGIKHIAGNHNMGGDVYTDYETGNTILYAGTNVPTTADVRMLAEDLGVSDYCSVKGFAVEIVLPKHWVANIGQKMYRTTGHEMWKRSTVKIGAHLGYLCEEFDPVEERGGSLYLHVDDLQSAIAVCIKECQRTHNGNQYSVWEVGMERNTMVSCCQWSSERNGVVDITAKELERYAEMEKQREEIITELKNE